MKRFLLPQLIVFALCPLCAAQTPEKAAPPCPVISVQTPAGIILSGEPVWYKAIVSGDGPDQLKFRWTVSKGKIVSGQGTDSIKMIYAGYPRIAATVEVTGLPTGCANTASEVYEFIVDPGPIELGEITGPRYTINRRLLAKIGREARKNPSAQLFVAL